MAKKNKASGLPDGTFLLTVKVPAATAAALRATGTASTSISGIIRDVMEDAFGVGKSAPALLDTLIPPRGDDSWVRFSVYCSTVTRDRGLAEVKRRELDKNGTRKPLGVAPAVAWLLVQRFR
jgi:hypothetical protein